MSTGDAFRDPAGPGPPRTAAELAGMLRGDGLVVHFQSKVDLRSGEVVGAEALARLHGDPAGTLPPERFVTLAERSGHGADLTARVLDAALALLRRLEAAGWRIGVSLNVSAASLALPGFPAMLADKAAAARVAPGRITLEAAEGELLPRAGVLAAPLAELRHLGFGLSLDDFGGTAGEDALSVLPLTEVKVDQRLVLHMLDGAAALDAVTAAVRRGHALGLPVVAEGVETQAHYDRAVEIGCDLAQGYLIDRPAPAASFERWLAGG